MDTVNIFPDKTALAHAAASDAIDTLQQAIDTHGSATWVLAGGTTPEAAYGIIASTYLEDVDWSKVTILIGDERIAPLDSPESNWHQAEQLLLKHIPQATLLRPKSNETAESGAGEYQKQLASLVKNQAGLPRFDLVWLGMGEDGHTLSLFPNHPDFAPTDQLVIPVHDAPKPPADRLSLTLAALQNSQKTLILSSGNGKAKILEAALSPTSDLPIAQAARLTHANWYVDQAAAELL